MNIPLSAPRCCQLILFFMCCLSACSESSEPTGSTDRPGDVMPDVEVRADTSPEFDADLMIKDMGMPSVVPLPETVEPTACGQMNVFTTSVTRPSNDAISMELSSKALQFERIFHGLSVHGTGLNADLSLVDEAAKAEVRAFAANADSTEGLDGAPLGAVATFGKAAGLYGGVGLAADAYRYMVLRDEGAACEEVDRARVRVERAIETLHIATRITGVEGVIVRALANVELPGAGQNQTVPLFNESGQALPLEKNNGTWRTDQSGLYPNLIWEDSCSRDMYVGWALAYAAVWEAIRTDPSFSNDLKHRLRTDAKALVDSLMRVGEEGFDLEIRDADGRRTFHGILHEHSVDRVYITNFPNGFNGLLAAGIVAGLVYVSGDLLQMEYLNRELIESRGLLTLARDSLIGLDLGPGSNFSGYNMAFTGAWLAARYLPTQSNREMVRETLRGALYNRQDTSRQPHEQSQALYHLVFAQSELGHFANGRDEVESLDIDVTIERVVRDLTGFPAAPLFGKNTTNCDEDEVTSLDCVAEDGTPLPLIGAVGWNDELVADVPVPIYLRPISNYYWRSNPYAVNGNASPLSLMPASDFRFVYWGGRLLSVGLDDE